MRIGVDARELRGHSTGVGRYLSGLLTEWTQAAHTGTHEFVLYSPEPLAGAIPRSPFITRTVPGNGGTWWEQIDLRRAASADRLDVFFAPGYSVPLALRVPRVVVIHDVSFAAHPEWFRMREGMRRRWLARQSARTAEAVITVSQFSRRELLEHLGMPGLRVEVILSGIAPGARTESPEPRTRVLYVGSIFNRRHVPDLIRAFAALARRHPAVALDIVGENRTYPAEDLNRVIEMEAMHGRVRWQPYVSDEELSSLYASAGVLAFLSEYEGFGLTPLEGLAAGVPAVLLDTPIAREICGDAAVYVRHGDIDATARALERLLFDAPSRNALLRAAPAVLARYDWPRAAAATLAVLESCAARRH